jgi:hypothetical protein
MSSFEPHIPPTFPNRAAPSAERAGHVGRKTTPRWGSRPLPHPSPYEE